MMEGFDYAWGYTPSLPAALAKAGAKFVIRYVGTSSKCITKGELAALHKAGVAVGLCYETTGVTFRGGNAAGQTDGGRAAAAARNLGAPAGTPIFFAIDTDTRDITTVKEYLAGCVTGSGEYKARLYAGFYVIRELPNVDHWQTYAWSAGHVSAHAGVYQYHNGVTVHGVSMDRCRTLTNGLVIEHGWLTIPSTTTVTPAPVTPAPVIVAAPVAPVEAPPAAPAPTTPLGCGAAGCKWRSPSEGA